MKPLLLFVLGLILIFFFFFTESEQERKDLNTLKQTNLKFSGIVTNLDQPHGYNAYGIITLHLLETNKQEYDARDSVKYFYCIIKNGTAEVYEHSLGFHLGDTLNIDTEQALMSIGSKGNEREKGSIKINHSKSYYEYINRNTGFAK